MAQQKEVTVQEFLDGMNQDALELSIPVPDLENDCLPSHEAVDSILCIQEAVESVVGDMTHIVLSPDMALKIKEHVEYNDRLQLIKKVLLKNFKVFLKENKDVGASLCNAPAKIKLFIQNLICIKVENALMLVPSENNNVPRGETGSYEIDEECEKYINASAEFGIDEKVIQLCLNNASGIEIIEAMEQLPIVQEAQACEIKRSMKHHLFLNKYRERINSLLEEDAI